MKRSVSVFTSLSGLLFSSLCLHTVCIAQTSSPSHSTDQRAVSLLGRVKAAEAAADTLAADFTYTVASAKQHQTVRGSMRLMKPNLVRIRFSYMAHPAFPNLMASDGKTLYTFTPDSFLPNRTFASVDFDPVQGAGYASGLAVGGGKISAEAADAAGKNLHLWDAVPFQSFFDTEYALSRWMYVRDWSDLKYGGETRRNGVVYRLLKHHVTGGNIAGGEQTDFEQRLYIGRDNLIHIYEFDFTSGGHPGIERIVLGNIKINTPMTKTDFAFTPPGIQIALTQPLTKTPAGTTNGKTSRR